MISMWVIDLGGCLKTYLELLLRANGNLILRDDNYHEYIRQINNFSKLISLTSELILEGLQEMKEGMN